MTTENEVLEFITQIQNYFGAAAIGSYVLYLNKLIQFGDLNDVDVLVNKDRAENLYKFMESIGYSQTINKGAQIGYDNARRACQWERLPQGDFKKEGSLNVDILVEDKVEIWTPSEIIKAKFDRGQDNDYETLYKIMSLKRGANDLKHYKDSTTGLYAIDKDPKTVSKEWIEENAFQLGD